ncbi:MAG: D-alanine--D-alanine ligase [Dehalococcoidia bacterium]
MKIGLAYDLKEAVRHEVGTIDGDDRLEEYDSQETVDALADAISALGHQVLPIGGGKEFIDNILREHVDFVFNIAEGRGSYRSREAQVPSILEMLSIPYSGSDPQCLAVCLDKPLTKTIVSNAGISTPNWRVVSDIEDMEHVDWKGFRFPAFVKPAYEGSSKGILGGCRVTEQKMIREPVINLLERYNQPVLIEEYIDGEEITVGIVGNHPPKIVGIMRVVPRQKTECFIYSLEVKRDWERLVEYECPAKLSEAAIQAISDAALKIFKVLGCRDISRVDFRVDAEGTPFFLEINPLPGLNPHSGDLPIMAGRTGWKYRELIAAALNAALSRYPECALK